MKKPVLFKPADFAFDGTICICPSGKTLHRKGQHCVTDRGYRSIRFRGAEEDCVPCTLRDRCLRTPEKTKTRQVAFFQGKAEGHETHTDRMKHKIDSAAGKAMITRRFATVEPVFGNLRYNKRLDRFTLRSKSKVDVQWKLWCMMHNIEKLGHHGYGM
ncbi:transposase [Halothiobacillus sp. DCM-1]|uniref:transposase n=1 Tax=Halothiobacillus sp. DCM-1 TaxID=3112558 RepID=UPI0032566D3A